MATIISSVSEIQEQLTRENRVHKMNAPTDRAESNRINKKVKKIRRDYQIKNSQSQLSAAKLILTS